MRFSVIDVNGSYKPFLHAEELPHVPEGVGGLVDERLVDGGAAAFGFYLLLRGGIPLSCIAEPFLVAVVAGDGLPDKCPVLSHLRTVNNRLFGRNREVE